jgi:phospho-N-acetylmuramoyl-pentapeptide-transferase
LLFYLNDLAMGIPWLSWMRLFQYVTFRGAMAGFTAFLVCVLLGPRVIAWLRSMKMTDGIAKNDSTRLDQLHGVKRDTPTMGGLLIVGGTLGACLLWANWPGVFGGLAGRPAGPGKDAALQPGGFYALIGMAVLVAGALLGFVDDRIKLRKRKGLRIGPKLFWQVAIAVAAAAMLYWLVPGSDPHRGRLYLPFVGLDHPNDAGSFLQLGPLVVVWAVLVIVGSCNAVNLADGLDGLAGGCGAVVAGSYAVLAYVASNSFICGYLKVPFVQGGGELAVCAAAVAGGCLGFLWYNCHPAEVFMGDTGSLPLGAFMGYTALVTRHELLLVLVGGVFVAEALSVLLQVASFRMFGRRIFRIAPLHHHFEFLGWSENKVVVRFWVLAILLALAGIATLKIR